MKYLFENIIHYIDERAKKRNIDEQLKKAMIDVYYCFYIFDDFWYHNSFSPIREKTMVPLKKFEYILSKTIDSLLCTEKNNEYHISTILYYCGNLKQEDFEHIFKIPEIQKNKMKVESKKYIDIRNRGYESWKYLTECIFKQFKHNNKINIFIQLYKQSLKNDILVSS